MKPITHRLRPNTIKYRTIKTQTRKKVLKKRAPLRNISHQSNQLYIPPNINITQNNPNDNPYDDTPIRGNVNPW